MLLKGMLTLGRKYVYKTTCSIKTTKHLNDIRFREQMDASFKVPKWNKPSNMYASISYFLIIMMLFMVVFVGPLDGESS